MAVVLVLLIAFALYFLPTIIAVSRHKSNAGAIFLLNLLLGWSFLGWVLSLVWACTAEQPTIINQVYMPPVQPMYGQPMYPQQQQPYPNQYGGYPPAPQGYLGQPNPQNYYQPQSGQTGPQYYPSQPGQTGPQSYQPNQGYNQLPQVQPDRPYDGPRQ